MTHQRGMRTPQRTSRSSCSTAITRRCVSPAPCRSTGRGATTCFSTEESCTRLPHRAEHDVRSARAGHTTAPPCSMETATSVARCVITIIDCGWRRIDVAARWRLHRANWRRTAHGQRPPAMRTTTRGRPRCALNRVCAVHGRRVVNHGRMGQRAGRTRLARAPMLAGRERTTSSYEPITRRRENSFRWGPI